MGAEAEVVSHEKERTVDIVNVATIVEGDEPPAMIGIYKTVYGARAVCELINCGPLTWVGERTPDGLKHIGTSEARPNLTYVVQPHKVLP